MKVTLTPRDLKTLEQDSRGLWSYEINTKNGKVKGSNIKSKEAALKDAEYNCELIFKSMLKR